MISSTFVAIFFLFIILMAASVAVLTIVYIARPRPKAKDGQHDAVVTSPRLEAPSPAEPGPHVTPLPPADDLTSQAGDAAITASSNEPPTKMGPRPQTESAPPPSRHPRSRPSTIPDTRSHTNTSTVAEQESVPPETAAGDNTSGEPRREQSDMKIGIFGSQSKDKQPEDAKLPKAAASKKESKTNESVRRQLPQPAALPVRQQLRERPENKPTPPAAPRPTTPAPAAESKAPVAPEVPVQEKTAESQPKAVAETPKTDLVSPAPPATMATPEVPAETKKAPTGGMSDLFAKTSSEPTENSRLADGMSDIDAKDLLAEGLGLVAKFRKPAK